MKFLTAIVSLLFLQPTDPSLLVLDKALQKPVAATNIFTPAEYQQHYFPVYASEAAAIIEAADTVVKRMERVPACFQTDTVTAGHTTFLLLQDCGMGPNYSVILITSLEESGTSFGFAIVNEEANRRKAQQKLLDFATYLAR